MSEQLEQRVRQHEEKLDKHNNRISKNERWRLQLQGGLKFAAFTVGTSLTLLGVFIATGFV